MEKATDPRVVDDRSVPLVGRRDEVQALVSALHARQSRLIVGAAGMGKVKRGSL